MAITTKLARVAGLVLGLFLLGVFTPTGYLLIVTLLFGGDETAIATASGADIEGSYRIAGVHHCFFRTGSGSPGEWVDVVRMP